MKKDKVTHMPVHEDNDNDLIKQLYEDNRKKDAQIEELIRDLRTVKEKPSTLLNPVIDNLTNQVIELRQNNREKTNEIRLLKYELSQLKSQSLLDLLAKHFADKGMTKEFYDLIFTYYNDYQSAIPKEEQHDSEKKLPAQRNSIGYCSIEMNKHYVTLPTGTKEEIKDLPESIYLAEGQFILVDENFRFKWAYPYLYEKRDLDFNLKYFALTVQQGSTFLLDKGQFPLESINNIPANMQLREKQIVGLDGNNNVFRFYKQIRHTADHYLNSAKLRGHQFFYILKCFPNGLHLRNIETNEESFQNLSLEGKEVKEQQIIVLSSSGEFLRVIFNSKFYTTSSYYTKVEHGTVEIKDSTIFIKKLSGELVIVNNISPNLNLVDGQTINVDEFNNFLGINFSLSVPLSELKQRTSIVNIKRPSVSLPKIDLDKTVLIIGNKGYDNNYKLALMRHGYKSKVVEGYEPFSKIASMERDADIVVVITSYISHENMWKIKKEIVDKPVIYSEYDGANRILEHLQKIEEDKKPVTLSN